MQQIGQKLRSIQEMTTNTSALNIVICEMMTQSIDSVQQKEATVKYMDVTSNIFSDQTGRFPKNQEKDQSM